MCKVLGFTTWQTITMQSLSSILLYKWKNHFSEMKGDVGMSLHEKEGEQEDA